PRRRRVGQHLRPGRHQLAVRGLQAIGLRPGQVDALAREVHRPEGDLDPTPGGTMTTTTTAGIDESLLIGGAWRDASSGERFDVTNPADESLVGTVPNATEADVRAAVDAASAAFENWSSLPAIERA